MAGRPGAIGLAGAGLATVAGKPRGAGAAGTRPSSSGRRTRANPAATGAASGRACGATAAGAWTAGPAGGMAVRAKASPGTALAATGVGIGGAAGGATDAGRAAAGFAARVEAFGGTLTDACFTLSEADPAFTAGLGLLNTRAGTFAAGFFTLLTLLLAAGRRCAFAGTTRRRAVDDREEPLLGTPCSFRDQKPRHSRLARRSCRGHPGSQHQPVGTRTRSRPRERRQASAPDQLQYNTMRAFRHLPRAQESWPGGSGQRDWAA